MLLIVAIIPGRLRRRAFNPLFFAQGEPVLDRLVRGRKAEGGNEILLQLLQWSIARLHHSLCDVFKRGCVPVVSFYHGMEWRGELLTANGTPIAPQIELLDPKCAEYRISSSIFLFGHPVCATQGTNGIKELEMVVCEENEPLRDTARLISLYKLLG